MLINSQTTAPPTTSRFRAEQYCDVESSGTRGRSVAVLGNGRESLAISLDQARLRMSLFELERKLVIEPVNSVLLHTTLGESLFPAVIDRVCFEAAHRENRQLEARLMGAFEDTPLEDGINHPAELIIDEALRSVDGQCVFGRLKSLSVDGGRPELAASVLRCLGRRRPGTSAWRAEIVRLALAADDIEMRDAAVQAAESWGGPEMLETLESHTEAVPWLHAYIEDVVEDLGE